MSSVFLALVDLLILSLCSSARHDREANPVKSRVRTFLFAPGFGIQGSPRFL